ncbi:MAG TPA: tRNA (guanosine(37)-N1)-methyltransferase TrmD [Armatimonadota bacterium]|nr:tRNA (guanosine(37)-N1)-methyltransferase TrmD [Armatimonadota bacterium]
MRIDVFTIFPEVIQCGVDYSMVKRAREKGIVSVFVHNIRDFAEDKHRTTDEAPYGGGAGMVMKPEPIFKAAEHVKAEYWTEQSRTILMSPQGELFTQKKAVELSTCPHVLLICGHYEGVDERVRENLVSDEISIGDYVLTGGELAALVVLDAVIRLVPGVLGAEQSALDESFSEGLLEYPQYTRPADFRGWKIPEVLLSGHHAEIAKWRRMQSLKRTLERRPDLLEKARLTEEDRKLLDQLKESE